MAKHEVLSNVNHKDMRVLAHCSAKFGHNVGAIQIFPNEIIRAQCEYPILFLKDSKSGQFQILAILGLHHEENLFLKESTGWRASYIPNIVKKGPFSIGFQKQADSNDDGPNPVVLIDTDDQRVGETQGESLFLEFGGNSTYLTNIQQILAELDEGTRLMSLMFNTLEQHDLIEPCALDITVDEDSVIKFEGYHTINAEKVSALSAEVLVELNQSGLLPILYAQIASLQNIQRLVMLKKQG